MNTSHLKQLLINRIQNINDKVFLEALKVMMDTKMASEPYQLSAFEEEKLRIARQQYANGETLNHSDVEKDLNEWLQSE